MPEKELFQVSDAINELSQPEIDYLFPEDELAFIYSGLRGTLMNNAPDPAPQHAAEQAATDTVVDIAPSPQASRQRTRKSASKKQGSSSPKAPA